MVVVQIILKRPAIMSSSRVPRPRTTSSTPRGRANPAPSTPTTPSRPTRGLAAPTLRTKTSTTTLKPPAPRPKTPASPSNEKPPSPSSPRALSIKEQIALRRAEQLKKVTSSKPASMDASEDGSMLESATPVVEDDILGRLSIRDTIDRAKSSGSLCPFL